MFLSPNGHYFLVRAGFRIFTMEGSGQPMEVFLFLAGQRGPVRHSDRYVLSEYLELPIRVSAGGYSWWILDG
jgi:hypothetical protein